MRLSRLSILDNKKRNKKKKKKKKETKNEEERKKTKGNKGKQCKDRSNAAFVLNLISRDMCPCGGFSVIYNISKILGTSWTIMMSYSCSKWGYSYFKWDLGMCRELLIS